MPALQFQITEDGEVWITGDEHDLRDLASWILRAAVNGSATPAYIHEEGATRVIITRIQGGVHG